MQTAILRLIVVLVSGLLSAVSTRSVPAVLVVTGICMVLVTAEHVYDADGGEAAERRLPMLSVTAGCMIGLGLLSGHWWGFLSLAALPVGPVLGTIAAMAVYAICAAAGLVSTRLSGFSGAAEAVGARHVAELLAVTFLVGILTGVILSMFSFAKMRAEKRREEQRRLRDSLIGEMHERKINRELAQQSFSAERNARLLERENISRNIHNNVGHSITAAVMTLDAADMLFETKPEEARKRMNDANERIRGSLESIRSAVRALDDEGGEVSVSDLRRYLDNVADGFTMDTERHVNMVYEISSGDALLPKEHAEFLTGVLQECLTNGVKHGGADSYFVTLTSDTAHVRLAVSDNGKGEYSEANADALIARGFGLRKIASYVRRCGGLVSFRNDDGFRTVVELPLSPEHE